MGFSEPTASVIAAKTLDFFILPPFATGQQKTTHGLDVLWMAMTSEHCRVAREELYHSDVPHKYTMKQDELPILLFGHLAVQRNGERPGHVAQRHILCPRATASADRGIYVA